MADRDRQPEEAEDRGERSEGGQRNGAVTTDLASALKSKELLLSAALSAAAALAAAKGPGLVRQLGSSAERRGEEEAEKLGAKGAKAAGEALQRGALGGIAGRALS